MEEIPEGQKQPARSRSNSQDFIIFKLLLVGDSGSGKSCLLLRFVDDTFSPSFATTIGIDFKIKTVTLPTSGKRVKLQIWDTAGQERFRTITSAYYRSTRAVLVVYDITNLQSFLNVPHWMNEVKSKTDLSPLRTLVGTKCDLVDARVIGQVKGRNLAHECGYDFVETSAKTDGKGVNALFIGIAERLYAEDKQETQPSTLKLEDSVDQNENRKKGCC